jgi:threonine dehydratase
VKLSVEARQLTETDSATTFADGIAVRVPVREAFEIYSGGADRIVEVGDDEIAEAMRIYFRDTHNVAEGAGAASLAALLREKELVAGAASLAALLREKELVRGKNVGVILTGGNIDTQDFATVLQGNTPQVA